MSNRSDRTFPKTFDDAELRQRLSAEQYVVTQQAGTERPFTGIYADETRPGIYACIVCGEPLFDAATKFDAGCGWPSFYAPLGEDKVVTEVDLSLGMRREEVLCAGCGAHLGHVFPDGPAPTGDRFCMNSASLNLSPADEE